MVSPNQANTILLLNLSFYGSKRYNEDVFPAVGLTKNFNRKNWPPTGVLTSEQQKMVVLTEKNFSNFITQNQHVMVVFYSSKYFWRERLSPESSAAAVKRKGNLVIAKVDAEKEKLLAKTFRIGNYPTIYFFHYGFIEEFYVDQQIWIPAETGKSEEIKPTKCQEDEEKTNFDAPLKEIQERVEEEAPKRSDEKIANMYPFRTSGQSTEIALDTTSDAESEMKFLNRLQELREPVKSHERVWQTGTYQNDTGGMIEEVGVFMEDDKNLKSSTDDKIKSGSTSLSWIPSETENGAKEENFDEPATKISDKRTDFSRTWTAW